MNNKGFAISVILYSMVFLLVSIFYMLLGIVKTRYNTSNNLREDIIEDLNQSELLYDIIEKLGDTTGIDYVEKYDVSLGAPIDTSSGAGSYDVYYYTSDDSNNLAGKNGNVIFGDFCWQIVRTTATGGIKLIYNGPKTNNNQCPNDNNLRPSSVGAQSIGITTSTLSGSKIYGESFEIFKDGNTYKFKLLHTNSYTWSDSTYQNLIGKYICGTSGGPTGTNNTCTVLYYVGEYVSNTQANTTKYTIDTNEHFSIIGNSPYAINSNSLAYAGYMFNEINSTKKFDTHAETALLPLFNLSSSNNYYFGSSAVWNSSTNKYDLKVDDGNGNLITPTSPTTLSSYGDNYKGLYTCNSLSSASCSTVYYIVEKYNDYNIHVVPLSNGQAVTDISYTWTYGTSYTKNGSNSYTLNNVSTKTFLLKDWYNVYSQYKNIYVCADFTSTTCSEIYYIGNTYNYRYLYNRSNNEFIYGNSVTYSNGNYTINTNSDPTKYHSIWEWYKDNMNSLSSSHYTCFVKDSNSCGDTVYYVLSFQNDTDMIYIELKNGDKIEDALNKMINYNNSNTSNVNRYSSPIKSMIESWYETNLLKYANYIDENAVYCNSREVTSLGSWGTTNSVGTISFEELLNISLECNNTTDRFSQTNTIAKLKYPIGLISKNESTYMKKNYEKTGVSYWTMSPYGFLGNDLWQYTVYSTGDSQHSTSKLVGNIRPVITLKGNVSVTGKGTYGNPYIVDTVGAEEIELRSITITAKAQTINRGSSISSATDQTNITATYSGEDSLRAGDYLQSINLTQSTTAVTSNGTITPANALIYDQDGNDVTNLYNISYATGKLVINDAPITGDPYTIEYYLGNGTSTTGETKIGTTSCTFGNACTLKTFASFNKVFPYSSSDTVNGDRGWSFYGWSTTASGTTRTYTDGTSINPGTYTATLKLYAIGRKTYRFNSGIAPKSYTTKYQYWNPRNTSASYRTSIDVPAGKDLSSSSNGSWTFLGYIGGSNGASNADVHFAASVAGTSYNPVINTGATGLMRAKYKRTLTIKYKANGGSGSTSDTTLVQYYNSGSGNADGTTNSGATLGGYAMTLRNNAFTRSNYKFKNWAEGSTSGTTYAAGASYNKLGKTVKSTDLSVNMYAMWNRCCTGYKVSSGSMYYCYTNSIGNPGSGTCLQEGYYYLNNICYTHRESLYC